MLSFQTVLPDTLELLKVLMQQSLLKDMRLVGGTSLALQYGHRRSVDLDFFGQTTEDVDELTVMMRECSKDMIKGSCTKRIKTYFLNGVKVDVVNYDYKWIDDVVEEDGLRLASPKDIAAMKVNAVMGRGTKKDFIDVYFLRFICRNIQTAQSTVPCSVCHILQMQIHSQCLICFRMWIGK